MHAAKAYEYRVRIAPVEEYPLDTDDIWLCNECAAQFCTTFWLRGKTIRHAQIWQNGRYIQTEDRILGVWEKAG